MDRTHPACPYPKAAIHDGKGDPLLVLTAPANAGMVHMLPKVLDEIRGLVGARRVTVVFDRGGYSPKLFLKLIAARRPGIDPRSLVVFDTNGALPALRPSICQSWAQNGGQRRDDDDRLPDDFR